MKQYIKPTLYIHKLNLNTTMQSASGEQQPNPNPNPQEQGGGSNPWWVDTHEGKDEPNNGYWNGGWGKP